MALRGSSLAIEDILDIVVGIVVGRTVNHSIVAHIAVALVGTSLAVTNLATVLLFPLLSVGQQLVEVHTEEFHFVLVGIGLTFEGHLQLRRNIGIIGNVGGLVPSKVIAVIDGHLIGRLGALGLNQDDTEGSTRTIDGGRGSILQYRDALDVLRIQERDIIVRNSIDHNQGVAHFTVAQGSDTTDAHRSSFVDVTRGGGDSQTRNSSLQRLGHILLRTTFHGLAQINRGYSTGQVRLLLRTITYNHHFVEQFGIFFQYHAERLGSLYLLCLIAHERDFQCGTRLNGQSKLAVNIGHDTVGSTFFYHTGTNDGFAFGIDHHAADGNRLHLFGNAGSCCCSLGCPKITAT